MTPYPTLDALIIIVVISIIGYLYFDFEGKRLDRLDLKARRKSND